LLIHHGKASHFQVQAPLISQISELFRPCSKFVDTKGTSMNRPSRIVVLLCVAVTFTAVYAQAQITPSADSYTNSATPTTNYGSKPLLDVDAASQITYLQFDLSSIPSGATISQATLKLFVNSVTTGGSFNVDYVNGSWVEGTIDSGNAPPLGGNIGSNVNVTTANKNDYILVNVTPALEAWLNGSETNNGIALVANGKFNASFDSKENTGTSHAPELDVVFASGSGTITGVTTNSGSGLTGGGTSGTLNLSLTNSCGPNQVLQWNGSAWVCATIAGGGGTITGVTAGTDLTGGGTSGNVTLGLDTTQVPQLAAANTFTGNQTVNGNLSATGAVTGNSFQIGSNLFGYGNYANQNAFVGFSGNTSMSGTDNTSTGVASLASNTSGGLNTASGASALGANSAGANNTALGAFSLNSNTTGSNNTAVGSLTLVVSTTGNDNTAIGVNSLLNNSTGTANTASGKFALDANTSGSNNTATGYQALINNTVGTFNTATGNTALYYNTTGGSNTGAGFGAGNTVDQSAMTGSYNSFLGYAAALVSGTNNGAPISNATAIGAYAEVAASNSLVLGSIQGVNSAPASTNVGIGTTTPAYTLDVHGSGNFTGPVTFASNQSFPNTISGITAGSGLMGGGTSGNVQVAMTNACASGQVLMWSGSAWLCSSISGGGTITGVTAGTDLTGGGTSGNVTLNLDLTKVPQFGPNTFIGTQTVGTGDLAVSGGNIDLPQTVGASSGVITMGGVPFASACCAANTFNTFAGENAGNFNLTGGYNTGVGYQALNSVTTATSNTAVGTTALKVATTGGSNTAVGSGALQVNTSGSGNTAVGGGALSQSVTGIANTAVGTGAGVSNTTGSSNTFLGQGADAGTSTLTNATAIGANAVVNVSNAMVLGAPGVSVGIGTSAPAATLDVHGTGNFTGLVTFAPGQTFSGAGTITGVNTVSGSGLTGGGTSGTLNVSLTPCANGQMLTSTGGAWACTNLSGGGTITAVVAGTDLVGGANSGVATLSLDTTQVPQLATANSFVGTQTVNGNLTLTGSGNGVQFPDGTLQTTAATNGSGGGIPSGYMIVGTNSTAPAGYTFTGIMGGTGQWASTGPVPVSQTATLSTAAAIGNTVYFAGTTKSQSGSVQLNQLFTWDTASGWNPVPLDPNQQFPSSSYNLGSAVSPNAALAEAYWVVTSVPAGDVICQAPAPPLTQWSCIPLPKNHVDFTVASFPFQGKNVIAVIGGQNTTDIQMLDTVALQFTTYSLLHPLGATAAVGLNGNLYLFGGYGQVVTGQVPCDAVTNSAFIWGGKQLANLPVPLYGAAATVLNGKIYLLGGITCSGSAARSTNAVLVYDPQSDTWSPGPPMPASMAQPSLSALTANNKIFAVTGTSIWDYSPPIYMFTKN
jgi:Kelch motif